MFSDTRYGRHAASASQDTTTTTRRARSARRHRAMQCTLLAPSSDACAFQRWTHKERPPQCTATLLPR
eukprot:3104971-Prymnesium_polylepis.1